MAWGLRTKSLAGSNRPSATTRHRLDPPGRFGKPAVLNLRSPREIAQMRQAGLLVWQAHQAVAALVQPGVTTGQLNEAVEAVFAEAGAIPLFKGVPGKIPFPAAACTSVNEEVVHGIPGDRVLQEGDIVSVDTGCKWNGWCGDAAATYPVGRIAPDVEHLLHITQQALDLAIELLGKCDRWSQVAEAIEQLVSRAGLSVVEQFVGHGIGREMHEPPQVPNFCTEAFRREGDFPLRTGLVLAIEPMVNLGAETGPLPTGPLDPSHRRRSTERPLRAYRRTYPGRSLPTDRPAVRTASSGAVGNSRPERIPKSPSEAVQFLSAGFAGVNEQGTGFVAIRLTRSRQARFV